MGVNGATLSYMTLPDAAFGADRLATRGPKVGTLPYRTYFIYCGYDLIGPA
jgi:hypothetical protein